MALEHLQDEERALAWLEQALEDDPSNADVRAALTHVRSSLTPPEPMPVPQEPEPEPQLGPDGGRVRRARIPHGTHAPSPPTGGTGARTRAFLAALSLEELGAADVDSQMLVDQFRSVAPIRARGTLDAHGWALLRPAGSDDVLARSVRLGGPRRRRRPRRAARRARAVWSRSIPTARLDETSTASVVRTFQWAARVLGVPRPDLYVVDEVPGEIAAVRQAEPTTAVGPSIVSGRSAKDLAFLAGQAPHVLPGRASGARLLPHARGAHAAAPRLRAARQARRPGLGRGESRRRCARRSASIGHITDEERAGVVDAVDRLQARGGRFSLGAFTRNAELMAARAGLFLCGDLATATAVVTTETRGIAGLSLEAKRRDLVAYCASEEHAALRARYAVTAPESMRPPAPRAQRRLLAVVLARGRVLSPVHAERAERRR